MARLHELIGEQLGEDADDAEVIIGTGTDRGPWVAALVAAGYVVYGVNPLQASRYRERHDVSGAMARFIRNDRLIDALMAQALPALGSSPGARAFYDAQRAAGVEHNAALRKLASRLVGILHGCLKTRTLYDESTAWSHRENKLAA
jgi:hypothetical protein